MPAGPGRPPPRWEEPLTQYYIKAFLKLLATWPPPGGFDNPHVETDPVYAGVTNPDIRKAIRNRRMSEKTYTGILKQLKTIEPPSLLGPPASKALTTPQTGKLATYKEQERRLDDLPVSLLSVESGLGQPAIKALLSKGLSGSTIVDLGFTVKDTRTSSELVQRLIKAGIEDWEPVIDVSRRVKCSVKLLVAIMSDIGADSVEEIVGLVDEAGSTVFEFADDHRMSLGKAWYIFLMIYDTRANHDLNRALDLLTGEYFWGWNEESGQYEQG